MQFLTLSRRLEKFSNADVAPRIPDEVQQARTLYSQGFIRQIWHRGDQPGACILWESDTEEHVREMLNSLPLVRARMIEIVAIIPLKAYAGFGPAS